MIYLIFYEFINHTPAYDIEEYMYKIINKSSRMIYIECVQSQY